MCLLRSRLTETLCILNPRCGYLIAGVIGYTEAHLVLHKPSPWLLGAPKPSDTQDSISFDPKWFWSPIPCTCSISGLDALLVVASGKNNYNNNRSSSSAVGGCFFKTIDENKNKSSHHVKVPQPILVEVAGMSGFALTSKGSTNVEWVRFTCCYGSILKREVPTLLVGVGLHSIKQRSYDGDPETTRT